MSDILYRVFQVMAGIGVSCIVIALVGAGFIFWQCAKDQVKR